MSEINILDSPNKCYILTDYNGNIYLKHQENFYFVFTDYDEGITLSLIKNLSQYEKYFNDYKDKIDITIGELKSTNLTLRGKIMENKNDTDNIEYNDTSLCDEKKYYFLSRQNQNEDEDLDGFSFNNVSNNNGIMMANLLYPRNGSFDVILMSGNFENKYVISSVEKMDGYINSTLLINTNGEIKVSFVDKKINCVLYFDNEVKSKII
jgi:hypothetical protein